MLHTSGVGNWEMPNLQCSIRLHFLRLDKNACTETDNGHTYYVVTSHMHIHTQINICTHAISLTFH